jgi:hypothetical protein
MDRIFSTNYGHYELEPITNLAPKAFLVDKIFTKKEFKLIAESPKLTAVNWGRPVPQRGDFAFDFAFFDDTSKR